MKSPSENPPCTGHVANDHSPSVSRICADLLTLGDCASIGTAIGVIHRLRPSFLVNAKYPDVRGVDVVEIAMHVLHDGLVDARGLVGLVFLLAVAYPYHGDVRHRSRGEGRQHQIASFSHTPGRVRAARVVDQSRELAGLGFSTDHVVAFDPANNDPDETAVLYAPSYR